MHHYIVGVRPSSLLCGEPSKEIDFVFSYTSEEEERFLDAAIVSKNRFLEIDLDQACKNFNVENLGTIMHILRIRQNANNSVMLHFTSDEILDEEFFKVYVKFTDMSKLLEAKV